MLGGKFLEGLLADASQLFGQRFQFDFLTGLQLFVAVAVYLLTYVLTFRFVQLRIGGEIIQRLQQAAILRFRIQPFAGAEEVHEEIRYFAPYPPLQEGQIAR